MEIISWNSCRFGNLQGIRALNDLVKREAPYLLFIQETKVLATHVSKVSKRMGFAGCLGVDCEGRIGGLALLWKKKIDVSILNF